MITTNTELINKLLNKIDLNEKDIIIINNSGSGNCFFKCISQFYTKKESYHYFYRKKVCLIIKSKYEQDMINYPYIYDNNKNWISFEDSFNNIILTGSYIGQYEIINACIENRCNIIFYRRDNISLDKKNYLYKYEITISDNVTFNPFLPTIIIGLANDNHYELLLPVGFSIEAYPIEYKITNNTDKNNNKTNTNTNKYDLSNSYMDRFHN